MKVLVCRCEDVTLHELEHAISLGHRDIESLKRYTGFGTGVCQGKSCPRAVRAECLPAMEEIPVRASLRGRRITRRRSPSTRGWCRIGTI